MTDFNGAITVITGAASGIGRATAEQAAALGARLVLTDINGGLLDEVVKKITANGGTVLAHRAFDISDANAVDAFADEVHAEHGAAHIVMNVAGISTWGRIQDLQREHWERLIDINLLGPIYVMSAFVPPMIEAGKGGHVVNVSSAAGLFGLPLHAAYSATKFGLRGVHEVLQFDLESAKIKASLVCPGAVDTPLVGTVNIVGVDREDPEVQKTIKKFQRHAVTPESAGKSIIKGVQKNRRMVYTSPDIRFGHLGQRWFPWGYNLVMRLINRKASQLLRSHVS